MASTAPKRSAAIANADIIAAIEALNSQEERGLAKHASTIIVAVVLALVLWVGSSLWTLNNTTTRMSANVDQLQKSISDLQSGSATSAKTIGDLQAQTARQDAKSEAIEADVNRVKERVRILEGQPPIRLDKGDHAPG